MHLALEFFYGVKAPPPPPWRTSSGPNKARWVSAGYKDVEQEAEYFENGREMLEAFYAKHIKDYALPLFVEYNFNLKVDGIPVTGKVDRVDRLPDGRLSILDYKTGKAIASERLETDAQLTLYQIACEELLGAEVASLIFYHVPTLDAMTASRRAAGIRGSRGAPHGRGNRGVDREGAIRSQARGK